MNGNCYWPIWPCAFVTDSINRFNRAFKAFLDIIPLDQASIWFCGKEMVKTKLLSDHIGKNEKSKVIVKIQKVSVRQNSAIIV